MNCNVTTYSLPVIKCDYGFELSNVRRKSNFFRYEGNPCYTPWFDRVFKAMDLIMDLDRLRLNDSLCET